MKILIADDELRLRKVIALYLSKCGHEIIEAGNGETAVELAKEFTPDAIVLDVMMPGISGIEATQAIRAISGFEKTPIILLTANASENDIKKGLSSGADKYITKPFSPKELVEIIEELVNK